MEEISIKNCEPSSLHSFDCGEESLNAFLTQYAEQNDEKGFGRTFVLLEEGQVVGFYTLASAFIESESLPPSLSKRLPRYPAPAIRIARLAVDKKKQKQGVGSLLLKCAFKRIVLAAMNAGVAFVLVDAKKEAEGFYEHYGFAGLSKDGNTFALPISVVLKAVL